MTKVSTSTVHSGFVNICLPFSVSGRDSALGDPDRMVGFKRIYYPCSFLLKHIRNIFVEHALCYERDSELSFFVPTGKRGAQTYKKIEGFKFQVYFFKSGTGIAAVKIDVGGYTASEAEDLLAELKKVTASAPEDGDDHPTLYDLVRSELSALDGSVSFFDHLTEGSILRSDSFASLLISTDGDGEEATEVAERLSAGYNSAFAPDRGDSLYELYRPTDEIVWAFSSRGTAVVATLERSGARSASERFFTTKWLSNVQDGYFVAFLLALHQKYASFALLNAVDMEDEGQKGRKTQKMLVDFKTAYVFKILSCEPFYQNVYMKMREVMNIEDIIEDLNDELSCQTEYSEIENNRRTGAAGFIISAVCGASVLIDTLAFATGFGFAFNRPFTPAGIITYGAVILECCLFALGVAFQLKGRLGKKKKAKKSLKK